MGPSNDLRTDNLYPVVLDEVDTNNRASLAGCSILTTPSRRLPAVCRRLTGSDALVTSN